MLTCVLGKAVSERMLGNHLLEQILLVEKYEYRGVLEYRVLYHLFEQVERLVHAVNAAVFEQYCTQKQTAGVHNTQRLDDCKNEFMI